MLKFFLVVFVVGDEVDWVSWVGPRGGCEPHGSRVDVIAPTLEVYRGDSCSLWQFLTVSDSL